MTLKSNNVPFTGSSKTAAPVLEPGNYPARIAQIYDLGLQAQRPYKGEEKGPKYEIMVTYELVTEFMPDENGNEDITKPRWVSERFGIYPLSSELAKSTGRYKILDPDLQYQGDWSEMLGQPCLVAVVNNKNKNTGKVYNNVGGISAPIKGMEVGPLVNEARTFDLDAPDMAVFEAMPDWIKGIIMENLEFKGSKLETAIIGGNGHVVEEDESVLDDSADDEDVPF